VTKVGGVETGAKGDRPRVTVSNATRLHAHRLSLALQDHKMLDRFCTSLWDKGWRVPLPGRLGRLQNSFWARRNLDGLDPRRIEQFPASELARLLSAPLIGRAKRDHALFWQKQRYDAAVAKWISRNPPDVFVGYEISCAKSMAAAKASGAMTILDLAGLPHDLVQTARERHGLPGDPEIESCLKQQKARELALADHVICLSNLARSGLIDQGIEASRISVVPLGTDLTRFKPVEAPVSNSGPLRLLFVGGVHRAKGLHTLLEAASRLGVGSVEVVIAGPVLDAELITTYQHVVRYEGFVEHDRLPRLYQECDVFVLPSLWESWGQVVVEAMASGKPAIVSDHCGSADLVTSQNGWIFPAGDADALHDCLLEAQKDRARLQSMGNASVSGVAHLGWAQYGQMVTETINNVWARWSARP
jgi:glycosyltransferase involved in cell wall biosynthesis